MRRRLRFTLTGKRDAAGRPARFDLLTDDTTALSLDWTAAHDLLMKQGCNTVEAHALLEATLHVGPVTERFVSPRYRP